jgi:hypothetical protein
MVSAEALVVVFLEAHLAELAHQALMMELMVLLDLLLLLTLVAVVVVLGMTLVCHLLVERVAQVTHELFIGVNYGTTLRIS